MLAVWGTGGGRESHQQGASIWGSQGHLSSSRWWGGGWGRPGGGVVDGVEPVFFNSHPACVLYNMDNMGGSDRLIVSEVLRREWV